MQAVGVKTAPSLPVIETIQTELDSDLGYELADNTDGNGNITKNMIIDEKSYK